MRGSASPDILRPLSMRLTRVRSSLFTRRIVSPLLRRPEHDFSAEERERQWQLRGWIGVGNGAADRTFVAGLEVSDERQGGAHKGQRSRQRWPGEQAALRDRGAHFDLAVELGDGVELGNA